MSSAISIGTGLAITAVAAAGATVYAANSAADATKSATNTAVNEQQWAIEQQENLSAPYRAVGNAAIGQYEDLLGLGPNGAAGEQAALAATPGYQFAKQQGTQATVNQASAMELGLSGNTLEGIAEFNTGLADQTYQNAVGNAQGAVAIGQNAAANTGSAIQSGANNISSAEINQGNTLAGIDVNEVAGLTKAFQSAGNEYATISTLQNLNNPGGGGLNAWGVNANPNQ
jgi:hypothetical protein